MNIFAILTTSIVAIIVLALCCVWICRTNRRRKRERYYQWRKENDPNFNHRDWLKDKPYTPVPERSGHNPPRNSDCETVTAAVVAVVILDSL